MTTDTGARLVADVVTGKLDVRDAASELPERGDDNDLEDREVLEVPSPFEA